MIPLQDVFALRSLWAAARGLAFVFLFSLSIPLRGQVKTPAGFGDPLQPYRQLLESGKVEAAEARLREYVRAHPESDRAVVLHALALVRLRQPLAAVQELELFLKNRPDSLVISRLYAELLTSASEDYTRAEEAWKRCIYIAPSDGEIWKELGGFYLTHARNKEAIQAFETATRLLPRSADAAAGLAFSYGRSGRSGNAERWFQKADALNAAATKPSAVACLLHAQYLLSRNQPSEALPLLNKSLSIDSHSAESYVWRGLCYESLRDPVSAEADALAALRESGRRRDALHLLLRLYKAQNRPEKLREVGGRLQQLDEEDYSRASGGRSLQEQLGKAERLLDEGRAGEASTYYQEIAQILPSYYEAYFALGICYVGSGRLTEAETAFRRYLEAEPRSVDGLAALGTLLLQKGRHKEAIAQLQRSLELDPDQPDVRKTLAQAYIAAADTKEAIAELEHILNRHPKGDLDVYLLLAHAYLMIKDETKAREALGRGASYFEASVDYWRGIAEILLEVNPGGALTEDMLRQLVRKFPADAASQTLFADWAYAKNDYDLCRQALETASSLSPREETRIRILALRAMMAGNQERPEVAEPLFRDAYAIDKQLRFPDQPSAMAYIEFLERYQRDEEAQRCVSEILSVVPGSSAAHFSRAKFLAKNGAHERALEEAELALAVAGTNRELQRTLHAFMARSYFAVGNKEEALKHQLWLEKNASR